MSKLIWLLASLIISCTTSSKSDDLTLPDNPKLASTRSPSDVTSNQGKEYFAKSPGGDCTALDIAEKRNNCGRLSHEIVGRGSKRLSKSVIASDVCKTIALAILNGSKISGEDFYHCHVLSAASVYVEQTDWGMVSNRYRGLLCHAREEVPRRFKEGIDDANILIFSGRRPLFVGRSSTAATEDLIFFDTDARFYGATLEFFEFGSPACELTIDSPTKLICPGIRESFCFGIRKPNLHY